MPVDTLTVLATLGGNRGHWTRALQEVRTHRQVESDYFFVLDEGTESDLELLVALGYQGSSVDLSPIRRSLVHAYNVGFRHFLAHPEYAYLHLFEDGLIVRPGWDIALRRTLTVHPEFGWVACRQEENAKAPFTAYCSLLSRPAVEAVGGLDPRYAPCYFDDGDLFTRLLNAGYTPQGLPFAVSHPVSRTGRSWDDRTDQLLLLEKRLLFQMLHGKSDFVWDEVPVHTPCELCR